MSVLWETYLSLATREQYKTKSSHLPQQMKLLSSKESLTLGPREITDKYFTLNEHVTYLDGQDKVLIRPSSTDTRQRSQANKEEKKQQLFLSWSECTSLAYHEIT